MQSSESSSRQLLLKGKTKEVLREADEVKQDVAEDTGKRKEQLKEADEDKLNLAEHSGTGDKDRGKGKEEVREADKVKLDVPEDTGDVTINVLDVPVAGAWVAESSMSAQRRNTEDQESTLEEKLVRDYDLSLVESYKKLGCFIHRVHSGLRVGSDKHYEPVLLSIGPYHCGNASPELENRKVQYFGMLQDRLKEKDDQRYRDALKDEDGNPQVLGCYTDIHGLMDGVGFIECMVRDGLFMIELFRRRMKPEEYMRDASYDILSNLCWMKPLLERDMLLFENQMPLRVLYQLYAMTTPPEKRGDFVRLVLRYFEFNGEELSNREVLQTQLVGIPHLLGLVYQVLVSCKRNKAAFVPETPGQLGTQTPAEQSTETPAHLTMVRKTTIWERISLQLRAANAVLRRMKASVPETPEQPNNTQTTVRKTPVQWKRERKSLELRIANAFLRLMDASVPETPEQPKTTQETWEFIRTAAALNEVGVTIVKADDDTLFHGIEYRDGVLSIPRLVIDDQTESLFRNLVAYEQYSKNYSRHRVTDYLRVMDCLINTPKDVELLRHCGIIDNGIGDDEKVSTMFNELCSGVYFNKKEFFYAKMFDDVNKFCKNRRNVWMGKLENEYFGSPWSVISFRAAVLLLFLTIVQTVFAILSYF